MTGRGAGYCTGNAVPGYMNPAYGRGRGFGGGGGRGWRHQYYATGLPFQARGYPVDPGLGVYGYRYPGEFTPENEVKALKNQADIFQKQIDVLNERIREIEGLSANKE